MDLTRLEISRAEAESREHWHCVYALVEGSTRRIFYIGSTSQVPMTRLHNHLAFARMGHGAPVYKEIRRILANGGCVEIDVKVNNLTKAVALEFENNWINCMGLDNLTNVQGTGYVKRTKREVERRARRVVLTE